MYLVIIGWLYVTVLMAVAEAQAPNGTVLGAIVTFVFYGLLPMGILGYILGTPGRKRALRARAAAQAAQRAEAARQATAPGPHAAAPAVPPSAAGGAVDPDASGEPAAAAQPRGVAPVREEP
ncbi:hypothetical protein [Acidovorax sp. Leaf160]|uniref:hypothetical protein n=1 Tax=Acidovorax sp. Leaf160 TaxID=1736280 RepID=UPI0009EB1880|nr:hypothetical protein [Acidovorax sp. Leaf160]